MLYSSGHELGRVVLAPPERRELKRRARKRSLAVELVKRAEVVLMLAGGHSYREIRERLDCSDEYIREWKKRFQEGRLAALDSRYRGSQRRTRTAEVEARILEATRQGPTHWSSYRLARKLGLSQSTVSRVWRHFGIQPHRLRGYMDSDDPKFEEKAADIIGLYLKPPVKAAVFCVDERALSKLSTDWIRFCPSPPAEPNAMALSIFVTARSHCMARWTLAPATSSARPPLGIPAPSLSTFWARSWPASLRAEKFTSWSTT
jgi:transposase